MLSATLLQLLTEKRLQYQDHHVEFDSQFENGGQFVFISAEPSSFKRMISKHSAWATRFEPILKQAPEIVLHHFEQGQKAVDFLNGLTPDDVESRRGATHYEKKSKK